MDPPLSLPASLPGRQRHSLQLQMAIIGRLEAEEESVGMDERDGLAIEKLARRQRAMKAPIHAKIGEFRGAGSPRCFAASSAGCSCLKIERLARISARRERARRGLRQPQACEERR